MVVFVDKTGTSEVGCKHKLSLAEAQVSENKNFIPVSTVFLNNSQGNLSHVFVIDAKDYVGKAGGVTPSSVALNHERPAGHRLCYRVTSNC